MSEALFDFPECPPIPKRRRAMGGHQSSRAETTTWLTPRFVLDALGEFDLDPCGAPNWPTAQRHIILPEDGLAAPWSGRVWLNPPYGNEAAVWLEKLAEHGRGLALIFARTETQWFVSEVWEKATAVLFLHGRIRFHRADGSVPDSTSGAPSCLVAYSIEDADVLRSCSLAGTCVSL
ncbi:phage N-6-adenine-methyltransferase [Rhodococcoides kyotonense]|uniref:DNA N-6-adenine-methyltransferase (Dam) n=1 Tax=Rhodococcoides kyotonense TaxID=398843 RepID=A0A239FQZ7_9NOCA|nr:phage N-6-adenine-methyltransferase [Rhodococcus kyotonensis]SNS58314.1 DNA N-6-adenine-methyltransferase (Dam) [Rhodococcus kyotonensis]